MENPKQYGLDDRTFNFAKRVRTLVKKLTGTIGNIEDVKQIIRSSGSVGANCIEANESLRKKDFVMRIKICRKESKVSRYWLRLIDMSGDSVYEKGRQSPAQEDYELMDISGSILRNTK